MPETSLPTFEFHIWDVHCMYSWVQCVEIKVLEFQAVFMWLIFTAAQHPTEKTPETANTMLWNSQAEEFSALPTEELSVNNLSVVCLF